jgi:hypothetical protein
MREIVEGLLEDLLLQRERHRVRRRCWSRIKGSLEGAGQAADRDLSRMRARHVRRVTVPLESDGASQHDAG